MGWNKCSIILKFLTMFFQMRKAHFSEEQGFSKSGAHNTSGIIVHFLGTQN